MDEEQDVEDTRRRLLTGFGLAAAGVAMAPTVLAQGNGQGREPKRYELDAWLDRPNAYHKLFIDSSRPLGGVEGVHYANNILRGHTTAYGGEESDFAIVVCFRRFATPLGWGDEIWAKYGEIFNRVLSYPDPSTGQPFTANPLNLEGRMDLPNRGATLEAIGARGVRYAVCDGATRVISGLIARATDGDADAVYKELVDSLIPHARFVPVGVLTVSRAQEYGYGLLYSGS
jgi:hypothetical protein